MNDNNQNQPEPLPKNIRRLQTVLALAVGLFAWFLWRGGWASFIAFVITFTAVHMGIAVIYYQSQSKK